MFVREAFKIEKKKKGWNFPTDGGGGLKFFDFPHFLKLAGNDLIRPEMQRKFFSILCTPPPCNISEINKVPTFSRGKNIFFQKVPHMLSEA